MCILGENGHSCALSALSNAENRIAIALLLLEIFVFKVEELYD